MSETRYTTRDIKALIGLSERTVRRWTEAGIIPGISTNKTEDFTCDSKAVELFRQACEMRAKGLSLRQIEVELRGQKRLFEDNYLLNIGDGEWDLFTGGQLIPFTLPFQHEEIPLSDANETTTVSRLPLNAEYILYFLLPKEEREVVIGDLIEDYGNVRERFGKRRANAWIYKQVLGSVWPLLRRAIIKISALVSLGQILRRLIS